MIRHQAPAQNSELVPAGLRAQYVDIIQAILIGKEHVLTVVTALRYMVRLTGNDYTLAARHGD